MPRRPAAVIKVKGGYTKCWNSRMRMLLKEVSQWHVILKLSYLSAMITKSHNYDCISTLFVREFMYPANICSYLFQVSHKYKLFQKWPNIGTLIWYNYSADHSWHLGVEICIYDNILLSSYLESRPWSDYSDVMCPLYYHIYSSIGS